MFRRSISMMLCICMVLSMMPLSALGAMAEDPTVPAETIDTAVDTSAPTEDTTAPLEETTIPPIDMTVPSEPEETKPEATGEPSEDPSVPSEESTEPGATEETEDSSEEEEIILPSEVPGEELGNSTLSGTEVGSGTCGKDVYWKLDDEGTLTIYGSGKMMGYLDNDDSYIVNERPGWTAYGMPTVKSIVIESGVTSIGRKAFRRHTNLTSVTIANTVTEIGESAFRDCQGLTTITLPSGVEKIAKFAFQNCANLTEITFPSTIKELGTQVFLECPKLKTVNMPGVADLKIVGFAFYRCTGLESITLPRGTKLAGLDIFSYCTNLTSVTLPDTLTEIPANTFQFCKNLKSINLPDSITKIGSYAFGNCESLTDVTIPKGLTEIPLGAFYWCKNLKNVQIPSGISEIGANAFSGCNALSQINIPFSVTKIGQSAFYECKGLNQITIPDSVTEIDSGAFKGCTGLTKVGLSESITVINSSMFEDCTNLTQIAIPSGVTEIRSEAFYGCNKLTKIDIPAGVTKIESGAFNRCSGLTSVTLPDGLKELGNSAFEYCSNLNSIYIPGSLEKLGGSSIFRGCGNLKTILFGGSAEQWAALVNALDYTFTLPANVRIHYNWSGTDLPDVDLSTLLSSGSCGEKLRWWLHTNGTLQITGTGEMYDYETETNPPPWYANGGTIFSVQVDEGVSSLGKHAFRGLTKITKVSLPASLRKIGDYAFSSCGMLQEIAIPAGVTELGEGIFAYCGRLKYLDLRCHMAEIPSHMFYQCVALESFNMSTSVKKVGFGAFMDCVALKSVALPDQLEQIDPYAFYRCTALESIRIPAGVTVIDREAFRYCTGLKSVDISQAAPSIEELAFAECTGIKQLKLNGGITRMRDDSFQNCTGITNAGPLGSGCDLEFGWSEKIPEEAFYGMRNLKKVTLPATIKQANNVFINNTQITSMGPVGSGCDLEFAWTTEIPTMSFWGLNSISKIIIPETVTAIQQFNFPTSAYQNITTIGPIGSGCDYEYGWKTDIPAFAFWNMQGATEFYWPEGDAGCPVKTIGEQAFYCCVNLKEIIVPENVEQLGVGAFAYCSGMKQLVVRGPVATIPEMAFVNCLAMEDIVLPKTIRTIEKAAFGNCTALKNVYFEGSQEDWDNFRIRPDNDILESDDVTIHCNWNALYLGDVRYVYSWHDTVGYLIGADGEKEYHTSDETDSAFRDNPASFLATYVLVESKTVGDVNILLKAIPVETRTGTVTAINSYYITIEGETYKLPVDLKNPEQFLDKFVMFHLYEGNMQGIAKLEFEDYLDNNSIVINHSGYAYAYYLGSPNQCVSYLVDETTSGTANSDAKGVLRIPLGKFNLPQTRLVVVDITKIGNVPLDPAPRKIAKVTVTPLEFKEKYTLSLGAKLSVGVGLDLPGIEATLGKVSASVGTGSALNILRIHSADGDSLELTSDTKPEVGFEFKSGINPKKTGNVKKTPLDIGAGIKGTLTGTYGLRFKDYSTDIQHQQAAIGAFFIGEALRINPCAVPFVMFYNWLLEDTYQRCGGEEIFGYGAGLSGNFNIKTNHKENSSMTMLGSGAKKTASFSKVNYGSDEAWLTSSYQSTANLDVGIPSINPLKPRGFLALDFMGKDVRVIAKRKPEGDSLEARFLSATTSVGMLFVGERYTMNYGKYTLKDGELHRFLNYAPEYRSLWNGDNMILGEGDIMLIGDYVSESPNAVPYSNVIKDQSLISIPFKFSLPGIADAEMGITFSYLESLEGDSAEGYVKDSELYLNAESEDFLAMMEQKKQGILNIYSTALKSLLGAVKEFFKEAIANLMDGGVQTEVAWVTEKQVNGKDWEVSMIYPDPENSGNSWNMSYQVSTAGGAARITEVQPGITGVGDYSKSKAATIGRPVILGVKDNKTQERVAEFTDNPLVLKIFYTQEDLEAAGLSMHSSVVQENGIRIYRYSDNGDFFEYIGGANDLEAMSVTADITKPGQYLLAVDACAPQLKELELSDFGANPIISAYVDDLTGLDLSKFRFALDGEILVDNENIADHFDSESGKFTYNVTGDGLTDGEHSMAFTLADTTGNAETYEYTFNIDLTDPIIEETSVTGVTNPGSVVEIRAKVTDAYLTGVSAVFSKLLDDGKWSAEAIVPMVQMEDGTWALDYEGDGGTIRVYVIAADIGGNTVTSETVEVDSRIDQVDISEEYIILRKGKSCMLQATVLPEEFESQTKWSTDNDAVIEVNEETGKIRAIGVGTAYVIATVTDGENTVTDRCRVDVTQALDVKGVQLSTTKATSELYSTTYTELDVLLMLEQNMDASLASNEDPQIPDANSIAIEKAMFKDAATAKLFDLVALDDRRIAIVPTDYAIKNPREVKGSYKSKIIVTVEGEEHTSEILTLTVKKSMPKLKATVPAFNSFYSGQEQDLVITGGTVTEIEAVTLPEWLTLKGETLSLNEKAPAKSASGKASLKIYTEEWRIPAEISLTVKNTYKAPGVKLSASSVTLAKTDSNGVMLKLVPSSKKDTLASLNVSGITTPEGYTISGFDATTGEFTLKGSVPGKITLNVSFHNTDKTVPLTLTVKTADVKLKLSKTSITLNKKVADSAEVTVTATPADHNLNLKDYRLTDAKGADKKSSGELTVRLNGDKIRVATGETTPANATYKLYVSTGGSKEVALTIKTIEKEPTVTFQAKGNLDLSFPNNEATITPTFKNYSGSFTFDKVETENYTLVQNGNIIVARYQEGAKAGTYTQKLILTLDDGSTLENTVKITVKRTAVKLKLSASKLTLNHKVRDIGEVAVSCTTKGYDFVKPVWALMDKSGKNPADGELNIQWRDGKLVIATNDATDYGATYKLLMKATEADSAVTLTITIPAESKSAVTATLKAKGSIDVIRDGSAITLTPTYKNVTAQTVKEAKLVFTKTVGKTATNADDLFSYATNIDGTFTITKAEGAKLDHSAKYSVELVATVNGQPIAVKPIALSVKQGSAKLTLTTLNGTMFSRDNQSRGEFTISAADASLNGIAKLEIKDAKYVDLFEIFDYEDGTYAIGYKDNKVPASLVGKTVTLNLNVFLEGNETAKANTTVKLKLTILK